MKALTNYHDYSLIPSHMMEGMKYYVENGCPLGGFLYAIFTNDLGKAVARADDHNLPLIPIYVSYIHNKLPIGCHGSCHLVKLWMESKANQKEVNEETNSQS